MENLIQQFFHHYNFVYWIFLAFNFIGVIADWDDYKKLSFLEKRMLQKQPSLYAIIGLVLFIMSFKY